jgi:hypothetical protein
MGSSEKTNHHRRSLYEYGSDSDEMQKAPYRVATRTVTIPASSNIIKGRNRGDTCRGKFASLLVAVGSGPRKDRAVDDIMMDDAMVATSPTGSSDLRWGWW